MNYFTVGGGKMGTTGTDQYKCFEEEIKGQEKEEGLDKGWGVGDGAG